MILKQTYINAQHPSTMLELIKQDADDTLDRLSERADDLFNIASLDVGDPAVMDLIEDGEFSFFIGGYSYAFRVINGAVYNVTKNNEYLLSSFSDGACTLHTDNLFDYSEEKGITIDSLGNDIAEAIAINNIVSNFTNNVLASDGSTTSVANVLDDYATNLSGQAQELYLNLKTALSTNGIGGVLSVLTAQYETLNNAEIQDDYIFIQQNQFSVSGFASTFRSFIGQASTIFGLVLTSVAYVASILIDGVTFVWNSLYNTALTASTAEVNLLANNYLYAQRVYLGYGDRTDIESNMPTIVPHLDKYGSILFNYLGLNVYMSVTNRIDDTHYGVMIEAFINVAGLEPTTVGYIDSSEVLTMSKDSDNYILNGLNLNSTVKVEKFSSELGISSWLPTQGNIEFRDLLIRKAIITGLMRIYYPALYSSSSTTGSWTIPLNYSLTSIADGGNPYRNVTYAYCKMLDGEVLSWEDIVEKLVPWSFKTSISDFFSWIKGSFNVEVYDGITSYIIDAPSTPSNFMVTPPGYSAQGVFLGSLLGGVVIGTGLLAIKGFRSLRRARATGKATRLKDNINNTERAYLSNPTLSNAMLLQRQQRRYAKYAQYLSSSGFGLMPMIPTLLASSKSYESEFNKNFSKLDNLLGDSGLNKESLEEINNTLLSIRSLIKTF